jgi:hypothetical protein
MDPALLAMSTAAALVLGVLLGLALTVPARRRVEHELHVARTDLATLRDRVDALAARLGNPWPDLTQRAEPDYVITSLPDPGAGTVGSRLGQVGADDRPSRRDFASVALAESALRVASLAYGVRRALLPESRNRIRFEMGREVKRARRERRRGAKEARRRQRADFHSSAVSRHAEDAA